MDFLQLPSCKKWRYKLPIVNKSGLGDERYFEGEL